MLSTHFLLTIFVTALSPASVLLVELFLSPALFLIPFISVSVIVPVQCRWDTQTRSIRNITKETTYVDVGRV